MIRPWSFVRVKKLLFQIYDDGIDSPGVFVCNLEYDFGGTNELYGKLKKNKGGVYLRIGLGTPIADIENSTYSKYLFSSPRLSKKVFSVKNSKSLEIIDLTEKTQKVISGSLKTNPLVLTDFLFLNNLLSELKVDVSFLGVEGSLLAGTTNAESDLDLVLYGEKTYNKFLNLFERGEFLCQHLEPFLDSRFGRATIYAARKHYSPLSEKEMIFHESRKPTGFLKKSGGMRKFSIVGILDSQESRRGEAVKIFNLEKTYKLISVATIRGRIASDTFGRFRPSFYSVKNCVSEDVLRLSKEEIANIEYVVDYLGNFYLQCKEGEWFECRGSIEELILDGVGSGRYRLNINHWDDHIKNKFYLKTIFL